MVAAPAQAHIETSPEEGEVRRVFQETLGRPPGDEEMVYWISVHNSDGLDAVVDAILASDEFAQRADATDEQPDVHADTSGAAGDPAEFSEAGELQLATHTASAPNAPILLRFDFNGPDRGFDSFNWHSARNTLFGGIGTCSEFEDLAVRDGALRLRMRPASYGSPRINCTIPIPGGHSEVWLQYKVFAEPGWVPVRGGKLPGLSGGAGNTGGKPPRSGEGFSARNMWTTGGRLVQYTYHAGQSGRYGDHFAYDGAALQAGRWHTVTHRVQLNDRGRSNGVIDAYFDGRQVLHRTGLVLRGPGHNFSVDKFLLTGFYGGSGRSWAPPRTTYLRFDDVVVAAGPIPR